MSLASGSSDRDGQVPVVALVVVSGTNKFKLKVNVALTPAVGIGVPVTNICLHWHDTWFGDADVGASMFRVPHLVSHEQCNQRMHAVRCFLSVSQAVSVSASVNVCVYCVCVCVCVCVELWFFRRNPSLCRFSVSCLWSQNTVSRSFTALHQIRSQLSVRYRLQHTGVFGSRYWMAMTVTTVQRLHTRWCRQHTSRAWLKPDPHITTNLRKADANEAVVPLQKLFLLQTLRRREGVRSQTAEQHDTIGW
jgi:hypothetical protein